jgi:Fungal protein kinase
MALSAQLKSTSRVPYSRSWSSEGNTRPLVGANAKRKPDLVLMDTAMLSKTLSWEAVLALGELTTTCRFGPKVTNQLIAKAFLTFQSQPDRRYVLAITICGSMFRLSLFDRAGVVHSVSSDIHQSPLTFVRVMAGLFFAPPATLGFDTTITKGPGDTRVINFEQKRYTINDVLFVSSVLRGRGTVCWLVQDEHGDQFVIKDCWADAGRKHVEHEFFEAAEGIAGIPRVVGSAIVKIDGKEDNTDIRRSLVIPKSQISAFQELELRVHRRLVMAPFGKPLSDFSSRRELISALIDVTQGMASMYP